MDTPRGYEQEPLEAATFVVLDLDRTLFDTNKFSYATMQILQQRGVASEKLAAIKATELSQRGNTFDLIAAIRQLEETISIDDFKHEASEYVYPGVVELLQQLAEHDVPYTILTYGGEESQRLKLAILETVLGQAAPAVVTNERNKSAWISHHAVLEEGGAGKEPYLVLPAELTEGYGVVEAGRVVVLDDKPENFVTENPLISGLLIDNDPAGAQMGALKIGEVSVERLLHTAA